MCDEVYPAEQTFACGDSRTLRETAALRRGAALAHALVHERAQLLELARGRDPPDSV